MIAAGLVMAVFGYALLETGVRAIGQPPWLVDPQTAAERVVALPAGIPPLLLGVTGAVIAMAGLFFFLNAVLPGRRARHLLPDRRAAVVVDDEVIAAALARRARLAANVAKEQVMVVVSRNRITVNVRPTSGVPLRPDAVLDAVRREAGGNGPLADAGSADPGVHSRGGGGMNNTPRVAEPRTDRHPWHPAPRHRRPPDTACERPGRRRVVA